MTDKQNIVTNEIGQLRIYLAYGETRGKGFKDRLFGRRLYRELIDAAKRDGLLNATAHTADYGYTNGGRIQYAGTESPNPSMSVCVEVIAPRHELEDFCKRHVSLLKDRMLVYKHLEHWSLHGTEIVASEATAAELESDSGPVINGDRRTEGSSTQVNT